MTEYYLSHLAFRGSEQVTPQLDELEAYLSDLVTRHEELLQNDLVAAKYQRDQMAIWRDHFAERSQEFHVVFIATAMCEMQYLQTDVKLTPGECLKAMGVGVATSLSLLAVGYGIGNLILKLKE
jgi:hypothetical protein